MSALREEPHHLIDQLPEEQVAPMLALVRESLPVGAVTGIVPAAASAATCQSWTGAQPPSPGSTQSQLPGVAVLSPCDVWAVGGYDDPSGANKTLILHWDGHTWAKVTSPNAGGPGSDNFLSGMAVTASSNAWAVGQYHSAGSTVHDQANDSHVPGALLQEGHAGRHGGSHPHHMVRGRRGQRCQPLRLRGER